MQMIPDQFWMPSKVTKIHEHLPLAAVFRVYIFKHSRTVCFTSLVRCMVVLWLK